MENGRSNYVHHDVTFCKKRMSFGDRSSSAPVAFWFGPRGTVNTPPKRLSPRVDPVHKRFASWSPGAGGAPPSLSRGADGRGGAEVQQDDPSRSTSRRRSPRGDLETNAARAQMQRAQDFAHSLTNGLSAIPLVGKSKTGRHSRLVSFHVISSFLCTGGFIHPISE